MRQWVRLILTTLLVTVAVTAAAIGLDWAWHTAPGSAPVAAVIGDPRVNLAAKLPPTPRRVPIYEVGARITAEQVQAVLGGSVKMHDGWFEWTGRSAMDPVSAMSALIPGVPWRKEGLYLGPATKAEALSVRTAGMSSAFTGTAVACTSFGFYQTNGRYLVRLSMPAHRIRQVGTTKVIPASVALLDVRHHRANTRLLPETVPLLPQRLGGARITGMEPITDVRLVQVQDPANPRRSKPVWVFDPVAEADAQR
jgi:hypothetical protein